MHYKKNKIKKPLFAIVKGGFSIYDIIISSEFPIRKYKQDRQLYLLLII
jgi:hypothetical protein